MGHAADDAPIFNVCTGVRTSIRDLAMHFGGKLGRPAIITGTESSSAWIWDATRSYELFGPPAASLDEMIDATVLWLKLGGLTIGKPTHFEVQDGQF